MAGKTESNPSIRLLLTAILLLALTACASTPQTVKPPAVPPCLDPAQKTPIKDRVAANSEEKPIDDLLACGTCKKAGGEKGRDACYSLRPGKKISCTKTVKAKNGKKKKVTTTTIGRCQPQSLIYARCRTGIDTCLLGDTSPVQWFACARKKGATTSTPQAGSVIVLAANTGHCMPTGHPAYVEEVCPNRDGTWTLRLSHTNYDRRCHLDLDAKVIFSPKTMQARFVTGPWSAWAKDLKVLGFIIG